MSKAIAIARNAARRSVDHARAALVLGCAAALILAGQTLPFCTHNFTIFARVRDGEGDLQKHKRNIGDRKRSQLSPAYLRWTSG